MIKNFIKVTLRNIVRQKTFSAINIFGFAIGLAVCMIISLYVYDDLSYDRFHENSKDIYRLLTKDTSVEDLMYGITSGPLVAGIKEGVPEVLASTRVSNNGRDSIRRADVEQSEDEETIHTRTIIADTGFFDVFDFKILAGNNEAPLQDPNGIYLTPEKAEQVFGEDDPIGKPVEFMEYLIKTYTNENETVLDFASGSGSTNVAAKNLKRNSIGIDNWFCEKNKIINEIQINGLKWTEITQLRLDGKI